MALPLATTTITVERKEQLTNAQPGESDQDPWDEGYADEPVATVYTPTVENVRAVIEVGAGRVVGPGESELVSFTLLCDPIELDYLDRVTDDATGDVYSVEWAITTPGIAGKLSSTRAGLTTRKGA